MTTDRIPILAVVGPTGVGKTKLCVAIAKALNGEVVSVDSLQVYRDAEVMTARPTPQEMEGVPHHLIDCLEATEEPDNFVDLAVAAIRQIHDRGRIPILCGGSTSLTKPLLFHKAVEFQRPNVIILHSKLSDLGQRLDDRIDEMIEDGIPEEAKRLFDLEKKYLVEPDYSQGVWKAIGYPELRPWAKSNTEDLNDQFEEGIKAMKENTRRYAKRQLLWIWSDLVPELLVRDYSFATFLATNASSFSNKVIPQGIHQCNEWLRSDGIEES